MPRAAASTKPKDVASAEKATPAKKKTPVKTITSVKKSASKPKASVEKPKATTRKTSAKSPAKKPELEVEEKRAKKMKLEVAPSTDDGANADVYITSSKACQAFKVRADELQRLVIQAKPGTKVFINTEKKLSSKPDRGTFAVKVKGKTLVELIAMPRPFTAMKALVIKDLADQVLAEL